MKHYRCSDSPVLTWPPSVRDYHRDGFPWAIGALDGGIVYSGVTWPYDHKFAEIWDSLQEGTEVHVALTGPIRMAQTYIEQGPGRDYVMVLPRADSAMFRIFSANISDTDGVVIKYEPDLTEADLQKHLWYAGHVGRPSFQALRGRPLPIRLDADTVGFGAYRFALPQVAFRTAFVSPFRPDRYVLVSCSIAGLTATAIHDWADYWVAMKDPQGAVSVALDGFYDKSDPAAWRFSDSSVYAYTDLKAYCTGGVCPLPMAAIANDQTNSYQPTASPWRRCENGHEITLDGRPDVSGRFPSLAVADDGTVGLTWEEDGDIILGLVRLGEPPQLLVVESGASDSYDPRIAWDSRSFLVGYLNNREGPYRLVGRFVDADRLSPEILLSEPGCFDVVNPDLAGNGRGQIFVAWTEWRSALRVPVYRSISERVPGEVGRWPWVPWSADSTYANAWGIDLFANRRGLWGAWNQHYPVILGVCATKLGEQATLVAPPGQNVSEDVTTGSGGTTVVDSSGHQWVVYSSDAAGTYAGHPQDILASYQDQPGGAWATPFVLSDPTQTLLCQTPRAAITSAGEIVVVYAGRRKALDGHWSVYLTRYADGRWSPPAVISAAGESARAPDIAVGPQGEVWVAWHSGTGNDITVKLVRLAD